ncbi:hypothetical protein F751_6125 [Auxenochlorella protothecoides]|uniref:Uncharacterized protein n=1 Tax=Auxenochlorella protothecoides TaxID=3075 RepID=A0A087SHG6_AUXPR|nr:hypothetical protein F751_6125 [Auxenochlorella protothecoides]KFM25170.1 hypothetical protein F751_6125 [Auxenochlorella protothecoides]
MGAGAPDFAGLVAGPCAVEKAANANSPDAGPPPEVPAGSAATEPAIPDRGACATSPLPALGGKAMAVEREPWGPFAASTEPALVVQPAAAPSLSDGRRAAPAAPAVSVMDWRAKGAAVIGSDAPLRVLACR